MAWFIVIITTWGAILPPVEFRSLSDCNKAARAINEAWSEKKVAAYCIAGEVP